MILILEKAIGQPQRLAIDDSHAARQVMTAQVFLLLDVGPLWSTALLMVANTLTELLVPHMGSSHIHGIVGKAQCQFLGIAALARALSTCD